MRSQNLMLCASVWLAAFTAPHVLAAQTAAESDAAAAQAVVPPRLLEFVPAENPSTGAGEAAVLFEIDIAADGTVSDARLIEANDAEQARVAEQAVRQFRFEPARRGADPIAVTIRYRYVFPEAPSTAPAEPAPPPAAAPPPAPNAPAPAQAPVTPAVTTDASSVDQLEEYEAVAEIEAPTPEPVKRTLEGPVLTRVPGTRGDALRAIEVLPGVGRTGLSEGDPLLRGAAGYESQTLIDGVPVPMLFHFGGLTSVYASRLIERVDLYPGNFGSRFGRAIGGIIEVTTRDPKTDRLHGVLELSLLENSVLIETPITEDLAVAVGARRTNIDFVYENLVPDATFDVVAAPLYYDYQASATWRLNEGHTLRFRGFGSHDSINLYFSEPLADSPNVTGDLDLSSNFQRAQVALESRWSERVSQNVQVTVGRSEFVQRLGVDRAKLDSTELYGRANLRVRAQRWLEIRSGLDIAAQFSTGYYYGNRPDQVEGDPSSFQGKNDKLGIEDTFTIFSPAAYLESDLHVGEAVTLTPGVRGEYFEGIEKTVIDPRLSARVRAADDTTIKAGVGLYSQAPLYFEYLAGIGNPDLDPIRALHTSAGVEQQLGEGFELGIEGFYKRIWDRVVATEGGVAPYFENDGTGRIHGFELSARAQSSDQFSGYLAYTLSRSERRDHDGAWRLFDYDQTHVLSIAAERALGRGWSLGGRFRLVSGNPETPIVGAVYDAADDTYRPVYGGLNSDRAPLFHQLDVRIEKTWKVGPGSVAGYLELINAYNAQNREGTSYSYDYTKSEDVTGLPLFPNLGIRGEL